jgi:microsomal dipeptidase-like Zn-dependent dipeptidase
MAGLPYHPSAGARAALAPDYGTDLDLVSFLGTPLSAALCPATIPDCGRLLFHGDHTPIDDSVGAFTSDRADSNFGAPLFNGWPTWRSTTHQQVYYKWLERAWRGGMRLMTMLAVDNEALCWLSKRRSDADCNRTMAGVDAQIAAAKEFESWLEQQPDGGWFEIVYDPEQAEAAIRAGKLAVVLGIEVDSLFECKLGTCNADDVQRKVDEYHALGIRHIYPIHDFDTPFGGTALWSDILNVGNAVTTGQWYGAETCSAADFELSQIPVVSDIPWLLGRAGSYPNYPDGPVCNSQGITALGEQLLAAVMDKGMLIDVDHMSARAIDDTIELARARGGYPLVTGHTLFSDLYAGTAQRHERMRTGAQLQAIRELGGLVSVMTSDELTQASDCKNSTHTFALNYQYALSQMQGPVAFGTDFNGLASHTGPRFGDDACSQDVRQAREERLTQPRLLYPFELPGFGSFEHQVTGQRTFDFNTDGLAHIGLLPDMIADLQTLGVDVEPLFRSAQAYVQTWKQALWMMPSP